MNINLTNNKQSEIIECRNANFQTKSKTVICELKNSNLQHKTYPIGIIISFQVITFFLYVWMHLIILNELLGTIIIGNNSNSLVHCEAIAGRPRVTIASH